MSPYHCPKCGKIGHWRRGYGFEHEMICMSSAHPNHETWEPGEIEIELREQAEELKGQHGDGI